MLAETRTGAYYRRREFLLSVFFQCFVLALFAWAIASHWQIIIQIYNTGTYMFIIFNYSLNIQVKYSMPLRFWISLFVELSSFFPHRLFSVLSSFFLLSGFWEWHINWVLASWRHGRKSCKFFSCRRNWRVFGHRAFNVSLAFRPMLSLKNYNPNENYQQDKASA